MSAPVAPFGGAMLGTKELFGFGFFCVCVLEQSSVPASTCGQAFNSVTQRGEGELMVSVYKWCL